MARLQSSFMRGFSEAFLADLGRVVAAWSHIESNFDTLFLSFIVMRGAPTGSLSDPRIKLLSQAFERRVRAFRKRLAEFNLSAETYKKTDRVLSQLMKLRRERDEIAHSVWTLHMTEDEGKFTLHPDSATGVYKSWRNSKPHKWQTVNRKQLETLFEKMDVLYWDLHALVLDQELHDQNAQHP